MTVHRLTRKSSRSSRNSYRKSYRSGPRRRARSSRASSLRRSRRSQRRPRDNRSQPVGKRKRRAWGAPLYFQDQPRQAFTLVEQRIARPVVARLVLLENLGDLRMADRFVGWVGQEILLGDIGDVLGLRIFREQMIERLVPARAHLRRDRLIPLFGVVELRID